MMKFITTIGVFLLTFTFSVALVGFPKTNYFPSETANNNVFQRDISSLLRRDINNGVDRDRKILTALYARSSSDSLYISPERFYTSPEYIEAVSEYANESASIDDTNLPADFQLAWQDHMLAWRDHTNFLNNSTSHCKMRKFKLSGESFEDGFNRQNNEINVTWEKVLVTAEKYGVTVPEQYR